MHGKERIAFLDYLRVVACFMVMVIHSCEPFYLGGDGMLVANRWDALCVTVVECLCRVCVPLFVMVSSYLLFPLAQPVAILATAAASCVLASLVSLALRRIPGLGRWICG